MRITHVVITDAFAGTERYVAAVAARQTERGHEVTVIGGSAAHMRPAVGAATWYRATNVATAVGRLLRAGRRDVVHTHLSAADVSASMTTAAHRAAHVSTRHIAAPRGASVLGRLAVPLIERTVDLEIANSSFVAAGIERRPDAVLPLGVPRSDCAYDEGSRLVVVVQRLEAEKDTGTALRAWQASGLAEQGWSLLVAGDGAELTTLQALGGTMQQVRFAGHVDDVGALLAHAGVLLAPTPREALGLAVLEAMSYGVPVVASAAGGHLETLPPDYPWTFPAGDAAAAGAALRALAGDDGARRAVSAELRDRQRADFDLEGHVDALLDVYSAALASRRSGPAA
ncbi:MAG: hypothetical protein QOI82_1574 [Actinomycetota bacterium]|nr:hypothetical protein [Actinomycetota bacterium]